jgi:hypothetical protein
VEVSVALGLGLTTVSAGPGLGLDVSVGVGLVVGVSVALGLDATFGVAVIVITVVPPQDASAASETMSTNATTRRTECGLMTPPSSRPSYALYRTSGPGKIGHGGDHRRADLPHAR